MTTDVLSPEYKVLSLPPAPVANARYYVAEGTSYFRLYVANSAGTGYREILGTPGEQGPEGPEGPRGPTGLSTYELAVINGFVGTEAEWLASLVGPQGPEGDGDNNASLTSLSTLGTTADRVAYTTGVDAWAETPLTSFARTLLDDADASAARSTLGLGTMAVETASNYLTTSAAASNYQPLDSDLTSIAALTTTTFGRSLLTQADASATRTTLGLAIGTDVQAQNANLSQLAGLTDPNADTIVFWDDSAGSFAHLTLGTNLSISGTTLNATGGGGAGLVDADYGDITVSGTGTVMTIDNDVVTYAKMQNVSATDKLLGRSTAGAGDVEEIACTAFGRSLIDDVDASAARTTLGLAIGTNVQAYDAGLASLAALGTAGGKIAYTTAADTWAESDITAFGRSLIDDADAATARSTLGLGTMAVETAANYLTTAAASAGYQPLDSDLTAIAGLAASNDDFIQRKAGAWSNRTAAQVKTDLGLTGTNSGDQTITLTGDVTGSGTGSFAATIANDAVTYAKMQNVSAASRLLGRGSASGSGDVEEITLGAGLSMSGSALSAQTNTSIPLTLNSSFMVWQRGTSRTASSGGGVMTADRWICKYTDASSSATVSRINEFTGGALVTFTNSITTETYYIRQYIPGVLNFSGKTFTVVVDVETPETTLEYDFYINAEWNISDRVNIVDTTSASLSNTRQLIRHTFTVPDLTGYGYTPTIDNGLDLAFRVNTTTAMTAKTFKVHSVSLFEGSGDFMPGFCNPEYEDQKLKRFYEAISFYAPVVGYDTTSGQKRTYFPFTCGKRKGAAGTTVTYADAVGNASRCSTYDIAGVRTDNVTPTAVSVLSEGVQIIINGSTVAGIGASITANSDWL